MRPFGRRLSSRQRRTSKIKAKIKAAVTNKKIHAIIINGGTAFRNGIQPLKRWMRCWKSDWWDSARCFVI